jgi:uncharacterized protein (TIGR03083 family)
MTAETVLPAAEIPRIGHDEAMVIAAEENDRFQRAIDTINGDNWREPTDCTRWDIRDVVVHVVASAQAQASPIEFFRQLWQGRKLTAEIGGVHWVDGLNEGQLRARTHLTPTDLPYLWASTSQRSLKARKAMPRPVRALPILHLAPRVWKPLGYLFDIGFTRDVWMHRIDLTRALHQPFPATADHDRRIVADIVAEWSTTHTDPFTLHLTGPAGGVYGRTTEPDGDLVEIDAIDCCRILSGRGSPTGVLHHPLPL